MKNTTNQPAGASRSSGGSLQGHVVERELYYGRDQAVTETNIGQMTKLKKE